MTASRPLIGLDLGGTKVYGVALTDGRVTAEAKRKTPAQGAPADVVRTMAEVVDDLGGPDHAEGVGVGAPGAVDPERGVVHTAPNLPGWDGDVALAALLTEALGGAPVAIDNDVNAAAVAEHRLGAGEGADDLMVVYVGTGVGAGLVLDGRLRRGPNGFGGEIGHTVVRPGGRSCGCGGRGHLEAYAGRAGMEREARERVEAGARTSLLSHAKGGRMTSGAFAKALAEDDQVAVELVDEAVENLGVSLASAVTLLDLSRVVVGGGLADKLGRGFVQRVEQAAHRELEPAGLRPPVVPAALGDRGGAIGAALLVGATRKSGPGGPPLPWGHGRARR